LSGGRADNNDDEDEGYDKNNSENEDFFGIAFAIVLLGPDFAGINSGGGFVELK